MEIWDVGILQPSWLGKIFHWGEDLKLLLFVSFLLSLLLVEEKCAWLLSV